MQQQQTSNENARNPQPANTHHHNPTRIIPNNPAVLCRNKIETPVDLAAPASPAMAHNQTLIYETSPAATTPRTCTMSMKMAAAVGTAKTQMASDTIDTAGAQLASTALLTRNLALYTTMTITEVEVGVMDMTGAMNPDDIEIDIHLYDILALLTL